MQYIWVKGRKKRKIHLVNKYGNSFCRVEHQHRTMTEVQREKPKGRPLCNICRILYCKGEHRRLEM